MDPASAEGADVARITVTDDGPLMIQGPCRVVDAEGKPWKIAGEKAWLCRCGQSSRKPFCDGSHKEVQFRSTARATG